jgi:hypothetical protein
MTINAKGDTHMDEKFGQVSGEVPDVNVDTIGQGSSNMVERIGNSIHSLSEGELRDGVSRTDVPTYKG